MSRTKEEIIEFVTRELTENAAAHIQGFSLESLTHHREGSFPRQLEAADIHVLYSAFMSEELAVYRPIYLQKLKVGKSLGYDSTLPTLLAEKFSDTDSDYHPTLEFSREDVFSRAAITHPNIVVDSRYNYDLKICQAFYQALIKNGSMISIEELHNIVKSTCKAEELPSVYTSHVQAAIHILGGINWEDFAHKTIVNTGEYGGGDMRSSSAEAAAGGAGSSGGGAAAAAASGGGSGSSALTINSALKMISDYYTHDSFFSYHNASDGSYFNIVKITDTNYDQWITFRSHIEDAIQKQDEEDDHRRVKAEDEADKLGIAPVVEKYVDKTIGLMALKFDKYVDAGLAVFMAFISDEPMKNAADVHGASIEMLVTVTASAHTNHTRHMGITRNYAYPKDKWHKNTSVSLHSFAAKFMHDNFPEKKLLITCPTALMVQIIVNALEEGHASDDYYVRTDKFDDRISKTSGRSQRIMDKVIKQREDSSRLNVILKYEENIGATVKHKDTEAFYSEEDLKTSRELEWTKPDLRGCFTSGGHVIAVDLEVLGNLGHFDGSFAIDWE